MRARALSSAHKSTHLATLVAVPEPVPWLAKEEFFIFYRHETWRAIQGGKTMKSVRLEAQMDFKCKHSHRAICELTIGVQVFSSSAVATRFFWGLGQIKEHLFGMLSNLEVSFRTSGLRNELTPCVLRSMLKPLCVRCAHDHAER